MHISIKLICARPICLIAYSRRTVALSSILFLSLHYIVYESILATAAQNRIIADSLLIYTAKLPQNTHEVSYSFLFHPIFHNTAEHYLRFSCIHLQTVVFQPRFPLYYFLTLSAIKIKSSAYSNSRSNLLVSVADLVLVTTEHNRKQFPSNNMVAL